MRWLLLVMSLFVLLLGIALEYDLGFDHGIIVTRKDGRSYGAILISDGFYCIQAAGGRSRPAGLTRVRYPWPSCIINPVNLPHSILGFGWGTGSCSDYHAPPASLRRFYVPFWILILAGSVLPLQTLVRQMRSRAWRRAGRCAKCGYDLRASPTVCPECGHSTVDPFPRAARRRNDRNSHSER